MTSKETYCEGLLAYRLWTVGRAISRYSSMNSYLIHIARVVIDSGAIYSAFLIVFLGFHIAQSNDKDIVLDLISPIIPVCFYMIILRVTPLFRGDNDIRSQIPPINIGSEHGVPIDLADQGDIEANGVKT
ncbi:hypothetical protein H2248_008757 [Termitomyces sp. 'cryptogamus']|nr:hypothetical protein H2248_008757 [Termitomyces sp. 'cryptogamus']